MKQRIHVQRIEDQGILERSASRRGIAAALQGDPEKKVRAALRGQKFRSFAKRCDGCSRVVVQKKNSEIQISFGQFRVDGDGAFVLGARFVGFLQRRVNVSELKVGISKIRL